MRLLVIDAYDAAGRRSLVGEGVTPAGELYARALAAENPGLEINVLRFGESGENWPEELRRYAGIVWTGSNLTVHRPDAAVTSHLEFARAAFAAGVAQFGSCWAIQLAAVAAGGECARNPRGREFGIGRGITATDAGRRHPLLRGRPPVYEAFVSHEDMVVALPPGAELLAGNEFCAVQALSVRHRRGSFWAVQYHPEYDFHEIARLAALRREQLVREVRFADDAEADAFVADFTALHRDADDQMLRRRHAVAPDVLEPTIRRTEIRNWLQCLARGELDATRSPG